MRLKMLYPVVLASASPRRRELLSELGVSFRVETADVQEITAEDAEETIRRNAELKASAAALRFPESLVIGADTVVECGGRIFGKPSGPAAAAAMLRSLSGREHRVLTGVSLCLKQRGLHLTFAEITRVVFKTLPDTVIRQYMELVPVLDKAGAYAVQEHGELLLECLDGPLSNVIGLPLERLRQVLLAERLAEPVE